MSRSQLEDLRQPSMAGAMQSVVGYWGLAFISVGVIVSVLGPYLAWTMMAAEVLYVAAKDKDMPSFLAKANDKGVPIPALVMTSGLVQVALLLTLISDDAFTFTLKLCSALSLIPYLLAAGYSLKLGVRPEAGQAPPGFREMLVAGVATFYTVFLVFAAGIEFVLFSFIVYAPGAALFIMSRREQGRRAFSRAELVLFVIVLMGAIAGIAALATGAISI